MLHQSPRLVWGPSPALSCHWKLKSQSCRITYGKWRPYKECVQIWQHLKVDSGSSPSPAPPPPVDLGYVGQHLQESACIPFYPDLLTVYNLSECICQRQWPLPFISCLWVLPGLVLFSIQSSNRDNWRWGSGEEGRRFSKCQMCSLSGGGNGEPDSYQKLE